MLTMLSLFMYKSHQADFFFLQVGGFKNTVAVMPANVKSAVLQNCMITTKTGTSS